MLLAVLAGVRVRTDMAEFLPRGDSPAARAVLAEARSGAATGLLLIGLEGAPAPDLAALSHRLVGRLRATGLFSLVAGGDDLPALDGGGGPDLFAYRYLLSPTTTEAAFTEGALHADLVRLLAGLRSAAAPLVVQYGLPDPPGAFPALLHAWAGDSRVRVIDGAWFAPDGRRAVLVARTRAGGMDVAGQTAAIAAVRDGFAAAAPGDARLLLAGPGVFTRDAARAIRGDVERIALLSTVLVLLLLWWRFRDPLVIAAIAMPVVLSVAAGALAVQAVFGHVHGVALGFGSTMLGIAVDYPVLMIGHRKRGEAAAATRARIGRAFILAVTTAVLGLSAMIASGFPGLAQLGVFAAVGLVTAAVVTWVALPRLVVAANLAPVAAGSPVWLARVEAWRRWRLLGLLPVVLAGLYVALHGIAWQDDLEALSPVPAASRALDASLRAAIGAPDAGQIVMLRGPDAESVLRRQEALAPLLDRLRAGGTIGGAAYAARVLPSAATQAARAALLPDDATLAARLAAAGAGLPFRASAFQPFRAAVAASRTLAPLRPAALAGTPLAARLDPLLFRRGADWYGPVLLQGVRDPARVAAALRAVPDAPYVDMRAELGGILAGYTRGAWRWLGWSGGAVLLVLGLGLRRAGLVARVLASVAAALLVTAAALSAAGLRLSLLHLVALQLVAGVGLDYALFFARRQLDAEERARTLRTLVTCNGMTLLTFGLLAACQTPVLRDIGITVAVGAGLAMAFAFLFAGAAPGEDR